MHYHLKFTMKDMYKTKDLQLASYLLASGNKIYTPIKIGSIIYFQFETDVGDPDNIFEIEEDLYWQDAVKVSPKDLFTAYNELRLRIRNMT